MKKIILSLAFLSLLVSADSLPAEEEDFPLTDIKATLIQPTLVKEVTVFYPDASEDEDSVVVYIITVFKGSPSSFKGFDLDTEEGILY